MDVVGTRVLIWSSSSSHPLRCFHIILLLSFVAAFGVFRYFSPSNENRWQNIIMKNAPFHPLHSSSRFCCGCRCRCRSCWCCCCPFLFQCIGVYRRSIHKCITFLNIYYLYLRSEMVNVPTWESILLLVLRFQYAEQAAGCAQVSINKRGKNERRRRTKWNVKKRKKSNHALGIRECTLHRSAQHFNTPNGWIYFIRLPAITFLNRFCCFLLRVVHFDMATDVVFHEYFKFTSIFTVNGFMDMAEAAAASR